MSVDASYGCSMEAKMSDKTLDLEGQLRKAMGAAIRAGETMYTLSRDSGVDRAAIVRFMHGQRGLNMTSAGKLCRMLNLELRPVRRGKARG